MNPEKEGKGLLEFLQAVERGKELHPGTYAKIEWQLALDEEIEEYKSERCCECSECDDRCSFQQSVNQIVRLKSFMGEVTDIAVIAYRYRLFLAELIAEKERTFAG